MTFGQLEEMVPLFTMMVQSGMLFPRQSRNLVKICALFGRQTLMMFISLVMAVLF